jgi:hypothetical protein
VPLWMGWNGVASQGIHVLRANINIGPALLGMYNNVSSIIFACLFSDDSTTSNQDQFWINYWPNGSSTTTIPAGRPAGNS